MQLSKMPAIRAAAMMASMLAAASAARADDGFNTIITGYGTVGGSMTSDSNSAYVHDVTEFKGASNTFNIGLDSRIGVQAVINYGPTLSVVVQELAKERGTDTFSLGTEWAFVQYAPTADLKFRLGRVALGTFLISDSRFVGYAQPWFRAPNELYGSFPFTDVDGGQALWHTNAGPVGVDLQLSYGTTSATLDAFGTLLSIAGKDVLNVSVALQYKNLGLRVAETKLTTPLTLALGPATVVSFNDHNKYVSAGIQYDDGNIIGMSEWAKTTENNIPLVNLPLTVSTQWYVAGGYRLAKLTPLLMYGKYDPGTSLESAAEKYGTWSASLRYDVVRNIALKAQFSRPPVGNSTYFINANEAIDKRVNVYSVGADFVF
jgi:hypothetical protein